MARKSKMNENREAAALGSSVQELAARVITVLSNRTGGLASPKGDAIHETLRDAVLKPQGFTVDDTLDVLYGMGASDEDIVDVFIPDVARDLGNCWEASTLSFVQVSMGSARLQAMIPRLEMSHLTLDMSKIERADSHMMLIVSPNDDHTLGPMLFASQMRRMGYAVRLSIGRELGALKRADNLRDYKMILFSCAHEGALATVREIVSYLKTHGPSCPDLVLGGPILDHVDGIQMITGVDLVTNDISTALTRLNSHTAQQKEDREKAAE